MTKSALMQILQRPLKPSEEFQIAAENDYKAKQLKSGGVSINFIDLINYDSRLPNCNQK